MTGPDRIAIEQTFHQALEVLVEQVKSDEAIIAALLCGSLSHDRVWSKSDIDLVLVTIDDRKVAHKGISLYADGVNVHALLLPRAEFRKLAEGSLNNSFFHSFLAKGRLLYTHDDSLEELFERMKVIGERDTGLQLLRAGTHALGPIYKAHKWLLTRGDLDYTALWILYAATPLAQIEVLSRRLLMDREVIPQASKLNPEFFRLVYHDLLNAKKTRASVEGALVAIDAYVAERATSLFAPVLEHLRDVGEVRSCTEIEDHFQRNYDFGEVTTACEYLADQGIIGKAGVGARLTKRSTVGIEELAFFYRDT